MNNIQEIVKAVMKEAKLTEYQQHVKDELANATPEDFKDRGKLMKDIAKKWHAKK